MNAKEKIIMNANLFSRLFDGLDDSNRLAIETLDGRRISYGELIAAGRADRQCAGRPGVKPGDRVAAQTEKSVTALVLYLAAVRAGAVYLPLNTAYTLNELEYFITDAEPQWWYAIRRRRKASARSRRRSAPGSRRSVPTARDRYRKPPQKPSRILPPSPRADDDLAAILYTSGTTGRSKGAMLTHDNLASNSRALVDYWRFTDKDVLIHALPIYHTHGLFVASNVTLFAGGSMILLPKFDPELIIKLMARATALMGVPTFYTRLLQSPALNREPPSICGCSFPARRRCWRKPIANGPRAPATPCSSATA